MKTLIGLALLALPALAAAQTNPECTIPSGYTLNNCAPTGCEVVSRTEGPGSYDIPSPYTTYGCTTVTSGANYDPAYAPPPSTVDPPDPPGQPAPEIDPAGAVGALTLLAGLVACLRGRVRPRLSDV